MSDHSSLEILLDKYLNGSITEQERIALEKQLNDPVNRQHLAAIIDRELQDHTYEIPEDKQLLTRIQHDLRRSMGKNKARTIPLWVRRVAIAAVFIIMAGAGYYMWPKKSPAIAPVTKSLSQQDIAPGGNKALLQLADGSTILLDNAQSGTLAQQGNAKVVKLDDGRLSYEAQGTHSGNLYNTVSTPVGGQYQLTLADGSKVWLNSASSLRFPASFTGKERMVELTGEGYFEIAKNKAMPFHVKANGSDITVLGTHFNVNAYTDEAVTATTLLEGKVKVTGKAGTNYLDPGQQAAMDKTGVLKTLDNVNVEEVMAWKNGLFHFDGASLQSVLRQAARWYNVRFEYNANIEGGFSGEITRNVNLSQLLKILELTGKVKFTIQGNTVKVHQ